MGHGRREADAANDGDAAAQYAYENFKPFDPGFEERVRGIFSQAPFVAELGFSPVSIKAGAVVTEMAVEQKHEQQNGFIHAGVLATIADHTAGAAAGTLIFADKIVLTAECKINLLRPAKGKTVVCEAFVLKNGKTLVVADSYVYTRTADARRLVARATVTLAVV